MSTAGATGGGRYQHAINTLAHLQPSVALAAGAVFIVQAVTGPASLVSGLVIVVLLAYLTTTIANMRHRRALCIRCAANSPLDGPGEAARCTRTLKTWHVLTSPAGLAAPALMITSFALPRGVGNVAYALALTTISIEAVTGLKHRVLQPWCPCCRWDDGGDPEPSPKAPAPPEVEAPR